MFQSEQQKSKEQKPKGASKIFKDKIDLFHLKIKQLDTESDPFVTEFCSRASEMEKEEFKMTYSAMVIKKPLKVTDFEKMEEESWVILQTYKNFVDLQRGCRNYLDGVKRAKKNEALNELLLHAQKTIEEREDKVDELTS